MNTDNQLSEWARTLRPTLSVPRDPNDIPQWRLRLRRSLRRLLALPHRRDSTPTVRHIKSFQHSDVAAHRILVTLKGQIPWEAMILEPAVINRRLPAWLCLHGCIQGGMSSVTGLIDDRPSGRTDLKQFECDYALQLARRGYVTLSFDFPFFASRSVDHASSATTPACDHEMFFAGLMLGRPYLGWCLAEAMAAITVLRDWPTVQPGRIGVTGFSMGGTLSAMLAAVDPRVRAAAVSGRFPSWRERLIQGRVDGLSCVPGLLTSMDVGDILAAVAPKPLFVSQEVRNDLAQSRRLLSGVRKSYRAMTAQQKLTLHYDHAPKHRFVGQPLYNWIEKQQP